MQRRTFLAASLSLACVTAFAATGSNFPTKPVTIVQGFAAGGNADTIARLVGAEMAKALGQPVIVESQTGAGGTIAATNVARAEPDGYTLSLATGGHAVAGAMRTGLNYHTVDDFQMVSTITYFPFLLVVPKDSPYKTLAELLKAAKDAPQKISYGSAGVGTTHHLALELLKKMAGVDMLHVPYRGDAASVTALLSGDIPLIIAPPTAVMPNIQAGKLRPLATTGAQRWAQLPDVPTVAEEGVKGYDVSSWAGLMAPAGTPPDVISKLNNAVLKALEVPSVKERLVAMGGEVRGSTPDEMKKMVTGQLNNWIQVVKDANIPRS